MRARRPHGERVRPGPGRRSRVAVAVLTLLGAVALAALSPRPARADVAPSCPDRRPATVVTITTVPVVAGIHLTVGGHRLVTDPAGRAAFTGCRLLDAIGMTVPQTPVPLPGKRRAVFDRVYLADRGALVQLAFGVQYQVALAFAGLPTGQISEYSLSSSTGALTTYRTLDPLWLLGSRVVRSPDGLESRALSYSVDSVLVAGESVVNRAQTRFYPSERTVVRVPLLAFTVGAVVVDRMFGFPVGSAVTLQGPAELQFRQPLVDGRAAFVDVPRGSYQATAEAPGLRIARSLTLSKDQQVMIPVITWLDLSVLLGGPLVLALALILAPRPALRARLAHGLSWPVRRLAPLVRGRFRPPRRTRRGGASG